MTVLERQPPLTGARQAPAPEAPGPSARRWKWTGDDLVRLGEAGLLPAEGRFELLDGEIYEIMPPNPPHSVLVGVLRRYLEALAIVLGAHARQEQPVRLDSTSAPQPDVAVVRGTDWDYWERFPGPEDVLLIAEVCDASLEHDLERKLPAYARAGIPECWIVDVRASEVLVCREPSETGYRSFRRCGPGESIEPLFAAGAAIEVAKLFCDGDDSGDGEGG